MTELEKNQRKALERIRSAFNETLGEMKDMLPYVPDYFREKWEYDKAVAYAEAELTHLDGFLCITGSGDLNDGPECVCSESHGSYNTPSGLRNCKKCHGLLGKARPTLNDGGAPR